MTLTARFALTVAACAIAAPALAQEITINSFGGSYEEAHRKCVIDPFTAETGVKVNIVTAYSADAFAQLRAQKDAPQYDVIHFSGGQEIVAEVPGHAYRAIADAPHLAVELAPETIKVLQ